VTRRALWADERGSASVELVLVAPLLVLMLMFVVFCGRLADTRLRLADVAHQAARAATLARSAGAAEADASSTARRALTDAGVGCRSVNVAPDVGGLRPGGAVTVRVSCVVGMSDLAMLTVPGSTTLDATASSVVDLYRSDGRR
jgi:Flp pilus assembly protein TadG